LRSDRFVRRLEADLALEALLHEVVSSSNVGLEKFVKEAENWNFVAQIKKMEDFLRWLSASSTKE